MHHATLLCLCFHTYVILCYCAFSCTFIHTSYGRKLLHYLTVLTIESEHVTVSRDLAETLSPKEISHYMVSFVWNKLNSSWTCLASHLRASPRENMRKSTYTAILEGHTSQVLWGQSQTPGVALYQNRGSHLIQQLIQPPVYIGLSSVSLRRSSCSLMAKA